MADVEKVGLLTFRDGKILLCRKKHGTSLLILPGGKREPGESSLECLTRELREELGDVTLHSPERVGVYSGRAAGNGAKTVEIELFLGDLAGEPAASSEIAELIWFGKADDWSLLAPSLASTILPDLLARGLLPWGIGRRQ
jgi:8-oxo-dGTP pyrophosphatase MutT (NUDIX family)